MHVFQLLLIHHTQMGQTALHIAAEMGKVDVVEMILKAGVDLEIQDRVTDRVWHFTLPDNAFKRP